MMSKHTISRLQAVNLKVLGYPEYIKPEDMLSLDEAFEWLETKYGLVYEIGLDMTAEPKYWFQIHLYEYFGNYYDIGVEEWFLYRSRREAKLECLNQMIKYLTKENIND